jgi:triphosphoribosyl-dephospho-CoA synthase
MTNWQQHIAAWTEQACLLEVTSPKPGNVSPNREFSDSSVKDFCRSARAVAPEIGLATERPLGVTILRSVQATRNVVNHNTNLGIILLLAPLAAIPKGRSLTDGIHEILQTTTVQDSLNVYEAIRIAQPAALGKADNQDLNQTPTETLVECMRLAADRDLIARQYVTGFHDVLIRGVSWLRESMEVTPSQTQQIVWLSLRLMAEFGDSLIARKCGAEMSGRVQNKAAGILANGWPHTPESHRELHEFDEFLREDGHRRNPGTTADLVAGILFAALREGWYPPSHDGAASTMI